MSVKVSSWVWENSKAKGNDRLVLLCIADIADGSGEATSHARSLSYIAKQTRLARSTVQERVKSLVALGELEVVVPGNGRASSGYRVLMGVPESGTPESDAPEPRSGTQGGSDPVPTVPTTGTQGTGGPVPHHPVLIPSSPVLTPSPSLALVPDSEPDVDELFARFWKLYPRKVDKPGSQRKFKKAMTKATAREISSGLKRWLAHWETVDQQFIPHPSVWLHQERWNDDVPQPKSSMPAAADTIMRWVEGQ